MLQRNVARFLLTLIIIVSISVPPALSQEIIPLVFPVSGDCHFDDTFGAPRSGGKRTHEGIDIMASKMTPVVAAVNGRIDWLNDGVETSTANGLPYFNLMLRGDDGNDYFYIHLNNDTPGTDDAMGGPGNAYAQGITDDVRVTAGQHIAYVGDSGNAESTASHLHFEIHLGGYKNPINPYMPLVVAKTGKYFSDVESDHWSFTFITNLVKQGVINGYKDGTFKPDNSVSRAEFVKMVISASKIKLATSYKGYYADAPVSHWSWPYIEAAKRAGFIDIDTTGNFRPDEPINRVDAATIIYKACGVSDNLSGDAFNDVSRDFSGYTPIMTIKNSKIISGYPDGTYRPFRTINRAESSKVIYGMRTIAPISFASIKE